MVLICPSDDTGGRDLFMKPVFWNVFMKISSIGQVFLCEKLNLELGFRPERLKPEGCQEGFQGAEVCGNSSIYRGSLREETEPEDYDDRGEERYGFY